MTFRVKKWLGMSPFVGSSARHAALTSTAPSPAGSNVVGTPPHGSMMIDVALTPGGRVHLPTFWKILFGLAAINTPVLLWALPSNPYPLAELVKPLPTR